MLYLLTVLNLVTGMFPVHRSPKQRRYYWQAVGWSRCQKLVMAKQVMV